MQQEKQRLLNDKINTNFVDSLPGMNLKGKKRKKKVMMEGQIEQQDETFDNAGFDIGENEASTNFDNADLDEDNNQNIQINKNMPMIPNVSRDTDEQLHRKITTLKKQLRDAHKRTGMRLLRATTVSAQDELTQFDPNMSKHYEPSSTLKNSNGNNSTSNTPKSSSSPLKIKNKSKNSTPKSNKRAQFSKEKPDLIINKKVKVSTPKSKKQVLVNDSAVLLIDDSKNYNTKNIPIVEKNIKKIKNQSKLTKSKQKRKNELVVIVKETRKRKSNR